MAKSKVKSVLGAMKSRAGDAAARVKARSSEGPSPNPATNLILADIALRGGGRLLRNAVEHTLLGTRYAPDKAREIVKGRGMVKTLLGTAIARVATRSVPGALIVGGGLLAKTLYDRSKSRAEATAEGEAEIAELAEDGRKS